MFILSAPAPPEKGTGWAVRAWCCRPLAYASGGLWPTFTHQMARPAAKVGGRYQCIQWLKSGGFFHRDSRACIGKVSPKLLAWKDLPKGS